MSFKDREISLFTTTSGYKATFGVKGGVQYSATGASKIVAIQRLLSFMPSGERISVHNATWVLQALEAGGEVSWNGITALDFANLIQGLKKRNEPESSTEKHVNPRLPKDSLPALYQNFLEKILETLKAKNHDYTGSDDPFANFRASETYGVDARKGILLRAQDKFMRINTHIDKGRLMVEGESVEDAIADVIGYMLLLYGMEVERSGDGS